MSAGTIPCPSCGKPVEEPTDYLKPNPDMPAFAAARCAGCGHIWRLNRETEGAGGRA